MNTVSDLMREHGHRIGHMNVVQLYNGAFECYLHVKHGDPNWISTGHRVGRHPTMEGSITNALTMAFVEADPPLHAGKFTLEDLF